MLTSPSGRLLLLLPTLLTAPVWTLPARGQSLTATGLKMGINRSLLVGDDATDRGRTGLHAGGYVTVHLTPWLGVQPEFILTMKGGGAVGGPLDLPGEADVSLDYLEIPLLLVLTYRLADRVEANLMGGPVISFNSYAQFSTELGGTRRSEDIDNARIGDRGFAIGLGVDFLTTRVSRLSVHLRWTEGGLSPIENNNRAQLSNRVLSLAIGYGFR